MKNDLFDQIDKVWQGSKEINTGTKPASVYMTARFVSLDEDGFLAASRLNRKGTLPEWVGLPFLKFMTPNKSTPRHAYPKKVAGAKLTKKQEKGLVRVCRTFNVDRFHGMQIKQLLEAQGIVTEGE